MSSTTVALLGSREIGHELGKKGTTSDLTLYNVVHDAHAVTLIEPTQFPEKFPPLLAALAMADHILLVVPALNREIAEAAATADLFDAPVTVVLAPEVGEEEFRKALKGTRIAAAPILPHDLPRLRELLETWSAPVRTGPVRVRIDHAFPVKGVGAVALGLVAQGTLKAHDRLRVFPLPNEVEVRSIQVHDADVDSASCGERVGVALKGIAAEELARGQTLAPEGSLTVASDLAVRDFVKCGYYRGGLAGGGQANVLIGLQLVPARLAPLGGTTLALSTDRPVAFAPGEPIFASDLSVPAGPRLFGRGTLSAGP
jgi:selenocysteine-specific translation elongation factor